MWTTWSLYLLLDRLASVRLDLWREALSSAQDVRYERWVDASKLPLTEGAREPRASHGHVAPSPCDPERTTQLRFPPPNRPPPPPQSRNPDPATQLRGRP